MHPVPPSPADPALLNPTKVVGRRIFAWFLDALIGTVLVVGYALATFTNTEMRSVFEAELQCEVIEDVSNDLCFNINEIVYVGSSDDTGVLVLLWFGWVLLATIILPAITGWSPGKLIAGIRIAKVDTFEKAGLGANIVRALVWMLDAFPYFLPGLGGVLMLVTGKNQRLGDLAAGTVVIRAGSLGRPPLQGAVQTSAPPPGTFNPAPAAPQFGDPPPPGPLSATPAPPRPRSFAPPSPAPVSPTPPPPGPGSTATPPPPTGLPHGVQPPPPPSAAPPPPMPSVPAPDPAIGAPPVFPPPAAQPPANQPPPPVAPTSPSTNQPPPPVPPADRQPPAPTGPTPEPDPTEIMPVVPAALDEPTPAEPADEPTTEYTPVPDLEAAPEPPATPEPDAAPEPPATPAPASPAAPTEPPSTSPPRAGVDAPMWDDARDTYIQWDPEIDEWMEWSETQGRWVPISR